MAGLCAWRPGLAFADDHPVAEAHDKQAAVDKQAADSVPAKSTDASRATEPSSEAGPKLSRLSISHQLPGKKGANGIQVQYLSASNRDQYEQSKPATQVRTAAALSPVFVQTRGVSPMIIRRPAPSSPKTSAGAINGTGMKRKPWLP